MRAQPPAAPAQPDPPARPRVVPHRRGGRRGARARRRRAAAQAALPASTPRGDAVSAERGYLREAGNLLFHLVGAGGAGRLRDRQPVRLQGRRDPGRRQRLLQQPHAVRRLRARQPVPGPDDMEPFSFDVDDFDVDWLTVRPARRAWPAASTRTLDYRESPSAPEQQYDLKVNHPLTIGDTEVFLIGHGYAPGDHGPRRQGRRRLQRADDLPADRPDASGPSAWSRRRTRSPTQIGLEGEFYPTVAFSDADRRATSRSSATPSTRWSRCSSTPATSAWTPARRSRSTRSTRPTTDDADQAGRRAVPRRPAAGQTVELPDGLGSVSFDGVERWNKIQISQTPGKFIALAGVVLALIGLLGLAVHPAPTGLGSRPPGRVTAHWSRWPRSTAPAAATSPPCSTRSWPPCQAHRPRTRKDQS